MGMGIVGIPWNRWEFREVEADVVEFPRGLKQSCRTPVGMEKIVWDFYGNVVVFDFCGAAAVT